MSQTSVVRRRRPSVRRQHFQTASPLSHEADSYHISHLASIGRGTNKIIFCPNRIRTLVAMAAYRTLPLTYNGYNGEK